MSLRYVILHHTGIPQPHFDVMFETSPGSKLATWRSPVWPVVAPTAAERLDDHRRDYLEYEGPLTGNRGHATRVAAGAFTFQSRTDTAWELSLDSGAALRFHVAAAGSPGWLIEPRGTLA